MPYGVPVATVAIGNAKNAALLAIRVLGIKYKDLQNKLDKFMEEMRNEVLNTRLEA